jgi:hypothetical protein
MSSTLEKLSLVEDFSNPESLVLANEVVGVKAFKCLSIASLHSVFDLIRKRLGLLYEHLFIFGFSVCACLALAGALAFNRANQSDHQEGD